MQPSAARIQSNLRGIQERIADAASRSGRSADAVRLVAVTKYVDPQAARAVVEAGCRELGESRPQELWRKAEALEGLPVRWHLIGHLQRNKVKRSLPLLTCLHSGDSLRLLREVDLSAASVGRQIDCLLEVNVSGDTAKHGFAPDEMAPLLPELAQLEHIRIRGLMAMAGLGGDADRARREFAALRLLRDRLRLECPPSVELHELSMGMSGDYEIAIEEGATIVRVGTALFE